MNRTKIEWTDFTWNPVTGCEYGCSYCYARSITKRFPGLYPNGFEPTYHPERLEEPHRLKKPSKIYVVSMGDLLGDWVPDLWIDSVIRAAHECPQHIFQFLTKNPIRYLNFYFPENCWLGVTIEAESKSKRFYDFFGAIIDKHNKTFVSFEPLLGSVGLNKGQFNAFDWVIVGAQTGPNAKQPEKKWVEEIITEARKANCAIFLKDNLEWHEKIQEWPNGRGD